MRLLAVGLSHRTAPVELRESVDFARAGLDAALHALAARGVSPEAVVLSTCNRAEIYAVGESDAAADAITRLLLRVPRPRAGAAGRAPLLPSRRRRGAPPVPGRRGPRLARRRRAADPRAGEDGLRDGERPALHRHGHAPAVPCARSPSASACAARPDSAKAPSRSATPRSSWRKKIFGDLAGLNVLILGAGEMAELTGVHLRAQQVKQITIASRTLASAESPGAAARGPRRAVAASCAPRSPPPTSSSPPPARRNRC